MSQNYRAIGDNLYDLKKIPCIEPSLRKFSKNKTNRAVVKTGSFDFHSLNTV